jgi:thiamine biosynthesis lipoprotein
VLERRDFIDPLRIAATTHGVLDPAEPLAAEPDPDAVLLRFARRAMATTFEIVLPLGTADAYAIADAGLDEIDRLEQQMTVYRDDSEVALINARAAHEPVPVEESVFDLFVRCSQLHRESRGAFDIAVGPLIKLWGFYRRQGRMPTLDERRAALDVSGMRHVRLDPAAKTIAFDRPGVELNLGSVGKGHALDRTVRLLHRKAAVQSALIHGGHSSVYAVGSEAGTVAGWAVGLRDPDSPDIRLGCFRLCDRGLGISATTHQFFEHEGRRFGHLLDPRTAWPAEGIAISAATAPTAAEADALATAFFVLGIEPAMQICERRPELGAVLLTRGPVPKLEVIGMATSEFTPEPDAQARTKGPADDRDS